MSEENQLSTPDMNPAKKGIAIFPAGAPPDETAEITPTQIPAAIDAIMASGDEDRMSMKINRAEVYHGVPHYYKGAFVQIFSLDGRYYAFAKNNRGMDVHTRGNDSYREAMQNIYKIIERSRGTIL